MWDRVHGVGLRERGVVRRKREKGVVRRKRRMIVMVVVKGGFEG